jgi:large subunit ribosomal protein L24
MSALRLKKGLQVKVISGACKGIVGEVVDVDPRRTRVLVKGVNVRKKHRRAKDASAGSGILTEECFIHSSNVIAI